MHPLREYTKKNFVNLVSRQGRASHVVRKTKRTCRLTVLENRREGMVDVDFSPASECYYRLPFVDWQS